MPRKSRLALEYCPHHIVQRGHNGNAVFYQDRDYRYYLDNLEEWKTELGIKVYSYCLMTNHIHLIVGSGKDPQRMSELMKRLAGRHTRYINKMECRTGSLWDSRYKISPIETQFYLLQCCRYVEYTPVVAKIVQRPEDYQWSSYGKKIAAVDVDSGWLDKDPCYTQLADNETDRIKRYVKFVENYNVFHQENEFIKQAVERNQLTGSKLFIDDVEKRKGIRVEYRGRGRPLKAE